MYRGLTGLQANLTSTESTWICAEPTGSNVSPDDPNHSLTGVNYQLFSNYHPNESGPPEALEKEERMLGFVIEHEITHGTYNLTRAGNFIGATHVLKHLKAGPPRRRVGLVVGGAPAGRSSYSPWATHADCILFPVEDAQVYLPSQPESTGPSSTHALFLICLI